MTSGRNSKYIFTLENIDFDSIEEKYDLKKPDKIQKKTKKEHMYTFLDEYKKKTELQSTMIDHSKGKINFLNYYCFWCRHQFYKKGIGCPVRYVSDRVVKKYRSAISKNVYTIKEDITPGKREKYSKELSRDNPDKDHKTNISESDTVFNENGHLILCKE